MELKDFIKRTLSDIAFAVKESQEELINVAVINPPRNDGGRGPMSRKYFYDQRIIEFDIAVGASEERDGRFGVSVYALLGSYSSNTTNQQFSRISFSIPVYLSQGLPNRFDELQLDISNNHTASYVPPTATITTN